MTPTQVAHITRAKALWETIKILGLQNEKLALQAIEAALRDAPQAEPVAEARFFLDHGAWHDRLTGQHMYSQTELDDAVRDARRLLAEEQETTRQLVRALREALEPPTFMGEPVLAARPSAPTAVEPDERATCEWTLEDDDNGTWQSSCGELWSFIEGGPKENRVSFCHNCGKPAIVRASKGTPL